MDEEQNGVMGTILGLGEERMGEVMNHLLKNESFVGAMQNALTGGIQAKRSVDRGLDRIYTAVNVPSLDDVASVSAKLDEVEALMAQIQTRVKALKKAKKDTAKPAKKSSVAKKKRTKKTAKKTRAKKTSE